MSSKIDSQLSRRTFVGCCACLTAAGSLEAGTDSPCEEPATKKLFAPLAPEEEKTADSSVMVKQILNAKGCSCAESILLAALRTLKQPEELLHSAAAFGGGMGHRDLCGFLTGGFMALGNAAGIRRKDRGEMKALAGKLCGEYWDWWQALAPFHCRELKPLYDKEGYINMKKRVALKIEELILAIDEAEQQDPKAEPDGTQA